MPRSLRRKAHRHLGLPRHRTADEVSGSGRLQLLDLLLQSRDLCFQAFDFARFVVKVLRDHADATLHTLTNVRIELDGELARCESYVVAYHWRERETGTELETAGGRYVDRFERRGGEWKIAHEAIARLDFAPELGR